jgi:hypothetical protein
MKRFAFALIAALAFAQDDAETMDTTTDDATMEVEEEEDTSLTWESDITWDADTDVDQAAVNWGKNFSASTTAPAVDGVTAKAMATMDMEGGSTLSVMGSAMFDFKWEDSSNKAYSGISASWGMAWVSAADMTDPEAPIVTEWEFSFCSMDRDSGSLVASDISNAVGFWSDDQPLTLTKKGVESIPVVTTDATPVTAWSGSCAAEMDGTMIAGISATATRAWMPTEEAWSSIEIKNQEPAYMCNAAWAFRNTSIGYARSGCASVMVDITVPEPEPEVVVDETEGGEGSGANALAATAMAIATIAVMAF